MSTFARYALFAALTLALMLLPGTVLLAQQDDDNGNDNDSTDAPEAADNGADEQDPPRDEENGDATPDDDSAENGADDTAEAQQDDTIQLPVFEFPDMFVLAQEFTTTMQLVILVEGIEIDQLEREQIARTRTRIEAIESDDEGHVQKARFFVLARDVRRRSDGGPLRTSESPLMARHFEAERGEEGDGIRVAERDGEEQTGEAAAVFAAQFRALQSRFPLLAYLAEEPRAIGEQIALAPNFADGFFDLSGDFSVTELTVTPRRIFEQGEGEEIERTAVYDMVVELAGEIAEDVPAHLEMRGELRVDLTSGWPQSLELKGPLTIHTEREHGGQTLALQGKGIAELDVTY